MKARGVPLRYVEGLNDARTPLADFFSILLNRLRSFVIIIRWKTEGFWLALGNFLVHFIQPTARAAKDLPD